MIVAAVAVLVILVLAIILNLATPRDWPMTPGSIKAKKVSVDGKSYVMVEGDGMNYLGQIQSINMDFDNLGKRIVVSRFLIRKIVVNNQWPVFYPLDGMKPGKYSVVYMSSDGEQAAGNFDVP
jgi:hypothetical protein